MKKIFQILFCTTLLCACASVEPEEEDNGGGKPLDNKPQSAISVAEGSFTLPAEGGNVSTTVNCSDTWMLVDAGVAWCKPMTTSGRDGDTVSFSVEPNQSTNERSATYTLVCASATTRITITQKQKDALTVTPARYELGSSGGTIEIEVKANIEFVYEVGSECRDWVQKAQTRAMTTSVLTFNVLPNESLERREGTVKISGGGFEETIHIYQEGNMSGGNEDIRPGDDIIM